MPLALQFARLTQLIVLLVAATSAVTALLRTQVDRVVVRWSPRLSVVLGVDLTSAPLLPALATDADRYTLAVLTSDPLGAVGRPGPRGGLAGRDHRPAAGSSRCAGCWSGRGAGTRCAGWPCSLRTAPRRSG